MLRRPEDPRDCRLQSLHHGGGAQPPFPAERLLEAATALFAREGIRAVGVERIIEHADVARGSLYQSYGSKDGLIVAYLRHQDARDRGAYDRARHGLDDPLEEVLVAFDLAARSARRRGFRGCLYLNAATEFPDLRHPSSAVIREHREWLGSAWRRSVAALGAADPDAVVAELTLLYDGGLVGSKIAKSTAPIELAREMAARRLRSLVPGSV